MKAAAQVHEADHIEGIGMIRDIFFCKLSLVCFRTDVLIWKIVATDAVHSANGKYYVYVLSDSGKREVKWVEVGIREASTIEITSGLEEGEKVILK